jgi:hypothetical protein
MSADEEQLRKQEEQLRAQEEQLREQLKQLRIEDVLVQTVVTLVNLSGRRLTEEGEKDPEQARLGIEAARVLLPMLPEEARQPIQDALAQLQMLYVRETQGPGGQPGGPGEPAEQPKPKPPKPDIWTPGSQ